jgi:hypothetical protein
VAVCLEGLVGEGHGRQVMIDSRLLQESTPGIGAAKWIVTTDAGRHLLDRLAERKNSSIGWLRSGQSMCLPSPSQ